MHTFELFILKLLKMLRHVSIIRSSSGSCLFLAKIISLTHTEVVTGEAGIE